MLQRRGRGFRGSPTGLKLALIAFLSLALLIPLSMLSGVARERRERQAQAIEETSASWAGELELLSPVLVMPLVYEYRNAKNEVELGKRQVILYPEELAVKARVQPELRKRGIFTVPLYSCEAAVSGRFVLPPLEEFGTDAVRLLWEQASFALPLSSYQGLREAPSLDWAGRSLELDAPKPDMDYGGQVLAARLGPGAWKEGGFELGLSLRGSGSLGFKPEAKSARVELESSWTSPSFFGSALPDARSFGEGGMEASWRTARFGLGPRILAEEELGEAVDYEPAFGFSLFQPQGVYQKTDRALKYGLLFVIIPFAALFLFESLKGSRIHAIQYLFIGLANCLFFLLLLALSEHLAFDAAFVLAAGAVTCLCSGYSAFVLPRRRDGLAMAGLFAALYAYMFAALKSEDYALLIGAVGLLAILALVMIATRKLDWYRLDRRESEDA
ncbi:MAG TPA: cell envelope integrity protein CreD [Spirochaetales bacterium]|nr:cell envelope integrity protein CreD [Spirochaetales bacterium]HRY53678.1 cell envelope integrity protein CreD [Spirochaetia bacterium]HRZ64264.1 cell envelope integrity protein CreD [Spirochaetia bacterium]